MRGPSPSPSPSPNPNPNPSPSASPSPVAQAPDLELTENLARVDADLSAEQQRSAEIESRLRAERLAAPQKNASLELGQQQQGALRSQLLAGAREDLVTQRRMISERQRELESLRFTTSDTTEYYLEKQAALQKDAARLSALEEQYAALEDAQAAAIKNGAASRSQEIEAQQAAQLDLESALQRSKARIQELQLERQRLNAKLASESAS